MEEKKLQAGNPETTAAPLEGNKSATSTDKSTASGDGEETIESLKAKLATSEADKEVYKNGMLEMKKQNKKVLTSEELKDPTKVAEFVSEKVNEELEAKQDEEALKTKASEEVRLKERNAELERALESVQTTGKLPEDAAVKANTPSPSQNTYWSENQKSELRKIYESRGMYSSDQIDRMVKNAEATAKAGTATSDANLGYPTERKH